MKIYYMGIGAGGYGVYYDDELGSPVLVDGMYRTFQGALKSLKAFSKN